MSDMKLILETWKRFEETTSYEAYAPVILFENDQKTEVDFLTLLKKRSYRLSANYYAYRIF